MADGLKIRIDGDTAGFKKTLEGLGTVASKTAGVAVKGISAASAGVVALTGLAVKSYAEYEQLVGGVDTLFEASSQKVQQNAANAYKTAGVSANEYMQMATSFSASLKQSFDDTEAGISAAADAADVAITDMADNANKMGTPMERITDAYQGFAKQNYTMLDNLKLGYGGTKGEMERLLKDAQELSGVKYDINNLADVYSAIHVVQTELGITGTTAKEAASTIEGSASMMKASWENLMVGLADDNADFDVLLENFTNSVLTFGDNILPRIQTVLEGIGEFITGAAETLLPKVVEVIIATLPALVSAGVQVINAISNAIIQNLPALEMAASQIVGTLTNGIGEAIPILQPLMTLINDLTQNFNLLVIGVSSATAAITTYKAIGQATQIITKSWTAATTALNAMEQKHALTLVATNGGLTLQQTLVGLLTKQISLKTAATGLATKAQVGLNAAMSANPVGIVTAAIIALSAAIYGLYKLVTQETEAEKEHRLAIENNITAINNRNRSISESNVAFAEDIASTQAALEHTTSLTDELFRLVDANGEVDEANRGRVNFILGELNSALGTEYELVNGQIQKYEELRQSVYQLIEAKKAESYLNSYKTEYEEALKGQKAAQEELTKQKMLHNDALIEEQQLCDKLIEKERELSELKEELNNSDLDTFAKEDIRYEIGEITAEIDGYKTSLSDLRKENEEGFAAIATAEANVDKYADTIAGYETAMGQIANGETAEAIKTIENLSGVLGNSEIASQDFAEGTKEALGQIGAEYQNAVVALISALQSYEEEPSASAAAMVDNAVKTLQEKQADFVAAGGEMKNGIITGWDGVNFGVDVDMSLLLNELKSYDKTLMAAGQTSSKNYGDGFINTLSSTDFGTVAKTKGKEAVDGLNEGIDAHSPSQETYDAGVDFYQGFNNGILAGTYTISIAGKTLAQQALIAAKKELGIHSPSAVMRDEVGKMIPAGIAVGISAGEASVVASLYDLNKSMLDTEEAYQKEAENQEVEAFKRKYAEKRQNADDELDLAKKNAADLLEEDKKSAQERYDEQVKAAEKSAEEKRRQADIDLKRSKEDADNALKDDLKSAEETFKREKANAKKKSEIKKAQEKYDLAVKKAYNKQNKAYEEAELKKKRKLEDIDHDESEKKSEAHSDYLIAIEKAEAKEKEKITEATNNHNEKLAEISEEELAEIEENGRKKRLEQMKKDAEDAKKLYEDTLEAIKKINERQAKELEEAQEGIRSNFDNTISETIDMLQELGDLQDSFAEKVDDYGSLYNEVSLPTIELANGISMAPTKTELADIGQQNKELEEYLDIINNLKKRGNVPTELFNKFREMSVEEGTKFGQALLEADDETFNNYIKEFEEKGKLGAEISKALTEDEFEDLTKTLTDKFGMLPEEFFGFGSDAGKQFGDGFIREIITKFNDFKSFLNVSLSGLSPVTALPAPANNNIYNYSSNYFVQPQEGTSTLSQLRTIRNFELLKELRNSD